MGRNPRCCGFLGAVHRHAFLEWRGMRVAAISELKRTGVRHKASLAGLPASPVLLAALDDRRFL
jgi:hypothetical protein